jgi:hypothetical protein
MSVGLKMMGKDPKGQAKPVAIGPGGALIIDERSPQFTGSGKNLYNKEDATVGTISASGTQTGDAGWLATAPIKVIPNRTYVFNKLMSSITAGTAFFQGDTFISWISNANIIANSRKVTAPPLADNMRATNHGSETDWQIEEGSVSTAYEPYIFRNYNRDISDWARGLTGLEPKVEVSNIRIESTGKNLINLDTLTSGILTNSGVISPDASWRTTDYFEVTPGETYITNKVTSSTTASLVFYDEHKQVKSAIAHSVIFANNGRFVVPSGAYKARTCLLLSLTQSWQIELGNRLTVFETYKKVGVSNLVSDWLQGKTQNTPQIGVASVSELNKVSKNLVPNSNMTEEGVLGSGIVKGFLKGLSPAVGYLVDGSLGQKLIVNAGVGVGDHDVSIPIQDVVGGDAISVSFDYVYENVKNTSVNLRIWFKDVNENTIGQTTTGALTPTSDPVRFAFNNIQVPSATKYIIVSPYIRASVNLDSEGFVFFRNLQVEKNPIATDYEPNRKVNYIEEILKQLQHKELPIDGYVEDANNSAFTISKNVDTKKKVRAVFNNTVVRFHSEVNAKIEISTTGLKGSFKDSVVFNSANFPNLIAGSTPYYALLLPYTRNLDINSQQSGYDSRLCIITNCGQIYHNYPSRAVGSDGQVLAGDMLRFEESVVWDMVGRKYPSSDVNASGTEAYMPGLPTKAYVYSPLLNTDPSYQNTYGNGGFDKSIVKSGKTYARFYEPRFGESANVHSFGIMGTYEPGDKISLVATYRSNTASMGPSRICLFATDDGGRTWYNKLEFASRQGLSGVWGSTFNTTTLVNSYSTDYLTISRRGLVVPTAEIKEPAEMFSFSDPIVVSAITRASEAIVTTKTPHGCSSGDVIVFKLNTGGGPSASWDWLRNEDANNNSGGNGIMFQVEVLTATTFKLRQYVHNPYTNITCRHVHHINRVKDGWIIGTGETHPDGWMYYMQMKYSDTFSKKRAWDDFLTVRLNSGQHGVQRTLGAIMLDDEHNTLILGSDEALIKRASITIPGRTIDFDRSSTGVYSGKLADIDDFSKYKVLFEAKEVCYYFKEHLGVLFYLGQRGEYGLSFDNGASWVQGHLGRLTQYFYGVTGDNVVIDDFIFTLKR